ncbi:MAG: DUF2842 domain-containing protein [Paracoccus sp. (in: a-proteobacteria)]|uniref:DUF2842 domain-containing protein n=1 Tax=unclassified Paracoccus (in: a-proteobacteria) TaxID=2688777 RepID=UPI000C5A72B5|nr:MULTISPECIES: DUF2842 domain-containing protein [unclassified Paracoccus (in: a-proteobacteria)]MAN57811.1 hypothetical protein [Paracoccus sp. (in: a-proteobacteria)]MBA50030.1 hypothetical protein [Paracoccus sp. (in: a-proteobacteria)]MCS5601246.1 DUF2842 domain-containing protein [Paracoccus sp. (in: a-proteobacteria)]|tara:strand:+ start:1969 stop:2181 length:213 start_codon:yes stop_codon:yes gene_type:complete
MRLKTRKRLSLLILVLGLPAYIIVAVILVNWMDDRWGRQPIWIELAVYVLLGVIWILPLRRVFTGIGREE